MPSAVNFDSLPKSVASNSIKKTAVGCFLLVIILIGLTVAVGLLTNNKDVGNSPLIIISVIVGFGIFILLEVRSFIYRMKAQKTSLKQFAAANGWQFTANPAISDAALIPPHAYLAYDASRLIYSISGTFKGADFLLYTFQGALKTISPGYTIGYETILRLDGSLRIAASNSDIGVRCERTERYLYISLPANLFTGQEMRRLFSPVSH